MEQVGAFAVKLNDLERVISIVYYALVDFEKFDTSIGQQIRCVGWNTHLPELIFDHSLMVRDTLNPLQRRAVVKPIGF